MHVELQVAGTAQAEMEEQNCSSLPPAPHVVSAETGLPRFMFGDGCVNSPVMHSALELQTLWR